MSGGHFDYRQYILNDIADIIENHLDDKDFRGLYSCETIEKFQMTADTLRLAGAMLQRVDWLISGDDGEESFHKRWAEDCDDLQTMTNKPKMDRQELTNNE